MKHYKKESRFVSILTVHILDGQSLIDMMRYDRCCPATEEDAHKIVATMTETTIKPENHVIRLIRYAANDLPATEGRWRSFGCRVLDERSPDASPLSIEDALTIARNLR